MEHLAERPLHIFIDLTGAERAPVSDGSWPHPDRFTARPRRVTCVVRPGTWNELTARPPHRSWRIVTSPSAIDECSEAMARAGTDGAALLVLEGPVDASDEALYVLRECLERDPMFGWAAGRTRCHRGCCVQKLAAGGLTGGGWIPRRILAETDEWAVMPEGFASSLLLGPDVVGEFGPLDSRFASLPAALVHYLSRARRCGYRTVVANRAVMSVAGWTCDNGTSATRSVPDADLQLLRRLIPDHERGWSEFRGGAQERFEALSAHSIRAAEGIVPPSVLLDIRNVGGIHNGTSRAALGCVRALRALAPRWDVVVLANPAATKFHGLNELCDGWEVQAAPPPRPFAAGLRLSQPWHIQEVLDLHSAALFNAYFMLDTIAWDVVYAAPPGLEGAWSFLAEHADGFLFDSAFTERRFLARFSRRDPGELAVCHYPFDPAEYVLPSIRATPGADYILIVGNEFDHKDVMQTVELLKRAFPFQKIVALGAAIEASPLLRVYLPGGMLESEIHGLYAGARFVIFPSFYEGFGFPTVTALAYGKTLIARRSELLDEIAAHCPKGRLVAFKRRDELVGILGKLLHGEAVAEEQIGARASGRLRTWRDVGSDIKDFIERMVRQPARNRWRAREHTVNQLRAFHSVR